MKRTIIHIGMPRAASTFFQQEVFPKIRDFEFKGVDFTFYDSLFQRIQFQDDSYYNEDEIKEGLKALEANNIFLSNELLVGQSLNLKSTNRSRTARRLNRLFPDAEIVIFLRNQLSLLQSLYALGVYDGLYMKPEEFVHFSNTNQLSYPTFQRNECAESYNYFELVKLYQELFSKVDVFLFEDFKSNPSEFVSDFSTRLNLQVPEILNSGQRVNKSLSNRQIKFLRIVNRWKPLLDSGKLGKRIIAGKIHFIEHNFGSKVPFRFNENLTEKILSYYARNNQKLTKVLPELGNSENFKKYY